MKIAHYPRPSLTTQPGFVRFVNLNEELLRLLEAPLASLTNNPDLLDGCQPALDVLEDKENFVVQVELPGLKRENIDVALHEGTLTISGERKTATRPEATEIHRAERAVGRFERAIVLPTAVVELQVKANYTDGLLSITLPKTEDAKPKRITVAVN